MGCNTYNLATVPATTASIAVMTAETVVTTEAVVTAETVMAAEAVETEEAEATTKSKSYPNLSRIFRCVRILSPGHRLVRLKIANI